MPGNYDDFKQNKKPGSLRLVKGKGIPVFMGNKKHEPGGSTGKEQCQIALLKGTGLVGTAVLGEGGVHILDQLDIHFKLLGLCGPSALTGYRQADRVPYLFLANDIL